MELNEATGELMVELAGTRFRLHATMPRVAQYQAALGVTGFAALERMLDTGDARAVYHGLRCLCSSGNAGAIENLHLIRHLVAAVRAIRAALLASLPAAEAAPASGPDEGPDWQRFRELAYGVLGWSPAEFREATMRDVVDGLSGWLEARGRRPSAPPTRAEIEILKARYPDAPVKKAA